MKRRLGETLEEGLEQMLVLKRMRCLVPLGKQWMERSVEYIVKTFSRVWRVGRRDSSDSTPIIIAEYKTG